MDVQSSKVSSDVAEGDSGSNRRRLHRHRYVRLSSNLFFFLLVYERLDLTRWSKETDCPSVDKTQRLPLRDRPTALHLVNRTRGCENEASVIGLLRECTEYSLFFVGGGYRSPIMASSPQTVDIPL